MDEPGLTDKLKTGALRLFAERFTGRKFAEGVEAAYRKALRK
jgi:hypothetical protein